MLLTERNGNVCRFVDRQAILARSFLEPRRICIGQADLMPLRRVAVQHQFHPLRELIGCGTLQTDVVPFNSQCSRDRAIPLKCDQSAGTPMIQARFFAF